MRKTLLVLFMGIMGTFAHAQNRTITGTVTSQGKNPLIGATVTVPGTNLGTTTNSKGIFTLPIPADAKELEISFIGYKGKTIAIGQDNLVIVTMEEGTS